MAHVGNPSIAVPQDLRRPHRFVAATRDAFRGIRAGEDGRLQIQPRSGVVPLTVSRDKLRRALQILQAIFAEAERRGLTVEPTEGGYGNKAGVGITLRGHTYPIRITERTDRTPLTEVELERWNRTNRCATPILCGPGGLTSW